MSYVGVLEMLEVLTICKRNKRHEDEKNGLLEHDVGVISNIYRQIKKTKRGRPL